MPFYTIINSSGFFPIHMHLLSLIMPLHADRPYCYKPFCLQKQVNPTTRLRIKVWGFHSLFRKNVFTIYQNRSSGGGDANL